MSDSYQIYNSQSALELAKLQGQMAGYTAGKAYYVGSQQAATSIFNQAGYYAVQDTETGEITVKKLADDSSKTGTWYDQTTNTVYDFTGSASSSDETSETNSSSNSYLYTYSTNSDTSNSSSTSSTSSTSSDYVKDEDGNVIEITAKDLQDMVDDGIYDNLADALATTLAAGYYVSDDEQAALGLYSSDDEKKIQTMMEKYGLSRADAIANLDGKITDPEVLSAADDLKEKLGEVQDDQGFIGKAWNGIKNFLGAGVSSDDCEYAIEQFENGEISYEEASSIIDEYQSKQAGATSTAKTAAAIAAGVGAGLLTGGASWVATAAIGAAAGGAAKIGVGVADRASNNNDEDDGLNKYVAQDGLSGAVEGAVSAVAVKAAPKVYSKAKDAAGGAKDAAEKAGKGLSGLFKRGSDTVKSLLPQTT